MRTILPAILLAFAIVAPLLASPAGPETREKVAEFASRAPDRPLSNYLPTTVAQFRANCVACHDSDGRGEEGRQLIRSTPDFTDLHWQGSRADEDLRRSILDGKGRSMPPMRAKISPDDAARLVAMVRGFGGGRLVIPEEEDRDPAPSRPVVPATNPALAPRTNPEAPGNAAIAGVYRLSCQKCHGDNGKGDPLRGLLPGVPDFTNRHWQESTSKAQLSASILEGKNTHMPGFRSRIATGRVEELVTYVRAFAPPVRGSNGPQSDSAEDYDRRLIDLQKEFSELRRAYRELSSQSTRPN